MRMLLNGEWIDRDRTIDVLDPFDGSRVDSVPRATSDDAREAVESAVRGFDVIKRMPVHERARILHDTAAIVQSELEGFARTIAREGSKTIREARKEAARTVNTLGVSAEEAGRLLGETIPFDSFPGGETRRGYYYRFPIGVILCITPFNDPLNLVAHKLGPAIAGGNAVVLKPATATPLSALKLASAFLRAGLPPTALQVITGYGAEIGDALVENQSVRMISFTGGVDAGERITRKAGIKKIGMELGSDSPVIVWRDADVDSAVQSCVSGAFWAAGQNCIGVQRLYVHRDVYAQFKTSFLDLAGRYRVGDKLDEKTDMGPMINEGEAGRVERWVDEARSMGADVLLGGTREGALFHPTVLENVPERATIHRQEVFGPTVNLYPVTDLDDAIAKANSLDYGLLAGIFTQSVDVAFHAAHELDCGGVMINDSTDYRLDSMPFGGVKRSGLGREGVRFSLQEMTEPKVVCFNLPAR